MEKIIISVIFFVIAAVLFILSIRSFFGKGFLFNNAYIYVSNEERKHMNKKTHYRQTAIVFLLLGIAFAFNGAACLFEIDWIYVLAVCVIFATIIYAIISSIRYPY